MRLALVAPLLLSACAAVNTPEACRVTEMAEAPVRVAGGVPVVEVSIAGRPAHLMLDTGANGVVVGEAAFARLGLERDYARAAYMTTLGARTGDWLSKPVAVKVGALAPEPAPLYVGHFDLRLDGVEVDGLLGGEALSAHDVDLDMARGRLTLYKPRRCPDGPPPFAGPSTTLRAAGHGVHGLTIPVEVDGAELSAVLDTGTSRTLIDARRVGLAPVDPADEGAGRATTPDPVGLAVRPHRFTRLRVGAEAIEGPVLLVGRVQQPGFDALLGSDYWRERRVWISYAGRTVTIGPPRQGGAAPGATAGRDRTAK